MRIMLRAQRIMLRAQQDPKRNVRDREALVRELTTAEKHLKAALTLLVETERDDKHVTSPKKRGRARAA